MILKMQKCKKKRKITDLKIQTGHLSVTKEYEI